MSDIFFQLSLATIAFLPSILFWSVGKEKYALYTLLLAALVFLTAVTWVGAAEVNGGSRIERPVMEKLKPREARVERMVLERGRMVTSSVRSRQANESVVMLGMARAERRATHLAVEERPGQLAHTPLLKQFGSVPHKQPVMGKNYSLPPGEFRKTTNLRLARDTVR